MNQPSNGRAALVLPGAMFGPYAPLLMYAGQAARARGATVQTVTWTDLGDLDTADATAVGAWVAGQAAPALETWAASDPDLHPLLIGKSLGVYACELAAEHALPAIWLTPHLTDPWIVAALRTATAPTLLAGGTADEVWIGDLARELTPHVLEVSGADHGLNVPGPLAASAAVLGQVATAVEAFLDSVVWPVADSSAP